MIIWLNLNVAKLQKKSLADREEIHQILSRFWGHKEFRPLQEEIILSVLSGKDTLALMPTGGGKSITFQVSAMAMEGICIVITPLIALMKDQVDKLHQRKIKAIAIHSGMTGYEIDVALNNCVYGDFKFLYMSPERIATQLFSTRVRDMNVNLLAVDEAHCISQWGYDFRPSYLEIGALREILEDVPVLGLTATATPEVCEDIQERLSFSQKNLMQKSFNRENLDYLVVHTEDKMRELIRLAHELKGCGIVYVRSRKKCQELAKLLMENKISANYYHAGLKQGLRNERQQQWSGNQFRVMVATNAFGMGIDKPDVRFVIHMDLPDGPEAYFQEAGRAGRDEEHSRAILLYGPADKPRAEQRIATNFPGIPIVREVYKALCNYLQIPHGSGRGQQYDFEFGEFLHRYRFSAMVAHSSLQILAREGYLVLTEAFHNPSRIKFRVERDGLYSFQVKHGDFDGFIKLLLRSYSGLFSQFVRIDESLLARRSGLPLPKVYSYLKALSTRHIIHYIPRKEIPVLTFLEERLDDKNLMISPERYNFRKERYEKRIGEILRYASSETICRNQFLLSYFGQLDTPRCGRCDVCRKGETLQPGSDEFKALLETLAARLGEGPMVLDELLESTGIEARKALRVIEWLVEQGRVIREKDLTLRWKG
ncbi:MAG: RecQ family ATP-dependent DNA helicase [Bacteroidia bacterium]|nr:MAG: RecQ family ATP-dependent DNA helicase [Bacteroidia bacterium]